MPSKPVVVVSSLFVSAALVGAAATWVRIALSQQTPGERDQSALHAPTEVGPVIRAEGRVVAGRGGRVTVSAELSGTVDQVFVEEGATVRAGEPLASFRAPEQIAALREANAHAREARVTAESVEEETRRTKTLVESGALPRQALTLLVHQRDAARARRAAAGAATARLAAAASHARLVAPISGTVVARKIEPGETVIAGAPLFVVADLSKLRVEAEVDEFDAVRVQPAMKAKVTVDGAGGESLRGTVGEIGYMIEPRGIRPQDPARPLDAQILKVKIELERASPFTLRLGQRVSVSLVDADGA